MSFSTIAIDKRALTYFMVLLMSFAGLAAFTSLGQLEDPDFSIKTVVVYTSYPGASPQEVELEVTDRIEKKIQELKSIDFIASESIPGYSIIKANFKPEYWADRIPQEFDLLRRKITDVQSELPPGAGVPMVNDDFGDVFGLLLAVTADGYSYQELDDAIKMLRKELSLVENVARVDLWGTQQQVIYLKASQSRLTDSGLSMGVLSQTLSQQNTVTDAGHVDVGDRRLRIVPTGNFHSADDLGDLLLRVSGTEEALVRVGDVGEVERGYLDPPQTLMRFNGLPAIAVSITNAPGSNIVDMGRAVDARLAELEAFLPVGIELNKVHWQSDVVAESINGFFINLAEAVGIVLVVLTLAMGWRMGIIIGTSLILTILITFVCLSLMDIDLHRMSLGALVIALGMMVDNSIVVAEGYVVRLQKGMAPKQAAIEAADIPAWPLLGATAIAVMAFYPIFASTEAAGEYCRTLFIVVGISLLVSWVLSVTITPLQCLDMIKPTHVTVQDGGDVQPGRLLQMFGAVLGTAIKFRGLTIMLMLGLLVGAGAGFTQVKQLFFPESAMPKFMIDYWAPEGATIARSSADMALIEERLLADERISAVSSFVGSGPPRFYLPVEPEQPNPAYGQLIVNVHNFQDIAPLQAELTAWLTGAIPDATVPVRLYGVGPAETWKFAVRISGPAEADPQVLRELGQQGLDILSASPYTGTMQVDWRQRQLTVVPEYNQERGRWAMVSRETVAHATKIAYDGMIVGLYREGDELIPIIVRQTEEERQNVTSMDVLDVESASGTHVPLSQVVDRIALGWEESRINRRDRRRTITVEANPVPGVTLPTLHQDVVADFNAIELPPGYTLEWGGETESSADAQASLVPGVIPAVAIILIVLVGLFNAYRPMIIILLTIPFAVIGIAVGLLSFNIPFGFMSLLGAMSLCGMMIKNAIVLMDEIKINEGKGLVAYEAVVQAAQSRLRPVVLAAATTVLGVIPLLQDVFWVGMGVTVMAGLAFGTVITMVLMPVLYATLYRVEVPGQAHPPQSTSSGSTSPGGISSGGAAPVPAVS